MNSLNIWLFGILVGLTIMTVIFWFAIETGHLKMTHKSKCEG